MPFRWHDHLAAPEDSGAVLHELLIWPHSSLTPNGFVWFIGITAGMIALPVLAIVGSQAMWGLLPFVVLAVVAIWTALRRSWRQGETCEVMRLSAAVLDLRRHDPGRDDRHWLANPYWVRLTLREDGPVPCYLTLAAEGREIELGAFLSPSERRVLHAELSRRLNGLKGAAP